MSAPKPSDFGTSQKNLKRVYFETSVYNRLLQEDGEPLINGIGDFKRRQSAQIGFSAMIWEEFAHTPNPKRRQLLFDTALKICDPIFLLGPEQVMRADIHALVTGGDPHGHYFDDFAGRMKQGRDGNEIDEAPKAIFEGFKEHKKEFVPEAKATQKLHELDPYVQDNPHKTFAQFSADYRSNPRLSEDVKRICMKLDPKIGQEAHSKIDPRQLPRSFEGYYEHLAAMIFSYHFRKIAPRRNDNIDLSHATYFYHCDLLVTNDTPMADISSTSDHLAPRIMLFDKFIETFVTSTEG